MEIPSICPPLFPSAGALCCSLREARIRVSLFSRRVRVKRMDAPIYFLAHYIIITASLCKPLTQFIVQKHVSDFANISLLFCTLTGSSSLHSIYIWQGDSLLRVASAVTKNSGVFSSQCKPYSFIPVVMNI